MEIRRGGHLYVVNGRMGRISCDANVVSTSRTFGISEYWKNDLGVDAELDKPEGWGPGAVGRSPRCVDGQPPNFFVDVTEAWETRIERLGEQVGAVLRLVHDAGIEPGGGRIKPLVCIPVFGIGRGGLGSRVGEAIKSTLEAAKAAAQDHDIDVAVVAPDSSVYAAVQHVRRREHLASDARPEAAELGRKAAEGGLALFVGAGVSMPAGLPSWETLLEDLKPDELDFPEFASLSLLDRAEFLQAEVGAGRLAEGVVERVKQVSMPALGHCLLASLRADNVVTTNYDDLFEKATSAMKVTTQVVMPWNYPERPGPWILKLHGDATDPESIALTRGSFVGYDARSRPAGALFQSLLLTKHMLFVGVSMNDDNILRLIHEARSYVERTSKSDGRARKIGTLVDVSNSAAQQRLWAGHLNWIRFGLDGVDVPDAELARQHNAREMEVFLDEIAMYACTDASWVLDQRFQGLLSDSVRPLAERIRDLATSAPGDAAWDLVRARLAELGAGTDNR